HQWRRRHASGRVSIVRYADDFVMGFEKAADARRMLVDLKDRLAKFGLALHEDKTRLIEFGRLPALRRQQRGERRLETFAFLGFTHYCRWTRDGRFIVKHKTQSKRLTRKLTALRQEASRHMHAPMAEQQRWYACIVRGHYGYYGLPNNSRALSEFHQEVRRIWFRCLRQRSHKARSLTWTASKRCSSAFPTTASDHSPLGGADAMTRVTLGKSRVRESRTPGSVRAKAECLSYSTTTSDGRSSHWPPRWREKDSNPPVPHSWKRTTDGSSDP